MGPRFRSVRLVAVLTVMVAAACAQPPPSDGLDEPTAPLGSDVGPLATPAFPVSVTDDAGRTVEIAADPQRIVSLAPSNTEIVCALGACPRLVGVTDIDDHPPEVAGIADVVIQAHVDVEKVVEADPDLILAAGNELTPSATIEQLVGLGYPVMTLYAESLDAVYDDIELVGEALGVERVAAQRVAEMQARADTVVRAVEGAPRPRTLYEVSVFEGVVYTAGEGSFLASLIDLAGGEPVTGNSQSFAIELEEIVAADPELILLGDATYDPSITPESVGQRPGWGDLTAVRQGRVVPVHDDVVITRPGPRIVDGLEALGALIHPERFP
ncbi:MAG: ABC transporter substrate-binding protein [Candidatus Limnocylindria bacterium]